MVDGTGPEAVVLGVVGVIDRRLGALRRPVEADVGLNATGADATGPAGSGVAIPGALGTASGANEEVIPGPGDPHGHVGTEAAVGSPGGELEFDGLADGLELIVGPSTGHGALTRTRDLTARRSSMAA